MPDSAVADGGGLLVLSGLLEGQAPEIGEILALDASPTAAESGLLELKQRISYFRQSLDEVKRSVDRLPGGLSDDLTLPERITAR